MKIRELWFHVKHLSNFFTKEKNMKKNIINETEKAWLELGFDYMEALYEKGRISDLEFENAIQSYAERGLDTGYMTE